VGSGQHENRRRRPQPASRPSKPAAPESTRSKHASNTSVYTARSTTHDAPATHPPALHRRATGTAAPAPGRSGCTATGSSRRASPACGGSPACCCRRRRRPLRPRPPGFQRACPRARSPPPSPPVSQTAARRRPAAARPCRTTA